MPFQRFVLACLSPLLLFCACRASAGLDGDEGRIGGAWIGVDSASGKLAGLDEMARTLAACDVVFLGEEHDQDIGHQLQLELTKRILELRPVASLSFEMIERDAQPMLDRYLAGEIDEDTYLSKTRQWPNYREHYRPMVQLAKERNLPVIAANVPRPLASRVAHEGLAPVAREPYMPREVIAAPGDYWTRFAAVMGKPADTSNRGLAWWFLAQCVKDEAMAESIELALCTRPTPRIVIHYCGHFHSDHRLGTVERLLRRQPSLKVGVVTMLSDERDPKRVDSELAHAADYVWLVAK